MKHEHYPKNFVDNAQRIVIEILVPKRRNKRKHVAHRTCVGCREVLPKRSLIRIVRSPEGVMVDHTGKMHGRGAYLHNRQSCWERSLKGALAHALKTEVTDREKEQLLAFSETLPEEIHEKEASEIG